MKSCPRRCLVLGGEALTVDLLERIEALGGECEVVNHGWADGDHGRFLAAADQAGRRVAGVGSAKHSDWTAAGQHADLCAGRAAAACAGGSGREVLHRRSRCNGWDIWSSRQRARAERFVADLA